MAIKLLISLVVWRVGLLNGGCSWVAGRWLIMLDLFRQESTAATACIRSRHQAAASEMNRRGSSGRTQASTAHKARV